MKMTCMMFDCGLVYIPFLNKWYKHNLNIKCEKDSYSITQIETDMNRESSSKIIDDFVDTRKNMISDKNIFELSIVPTTTCFGKCSYCYAEQNRCEEGTYINIKDVLDRIESLSKRGISIDKISSVIIYGGEPLANVEELDKILSLFKDSKNICICTGLLYGDDRFEALKGLLRKHSNVTLSCSIDPPPEDESLGYTRIFPKWDNKETYNKLVDRISELINEFGSRFGYRFTITDNHWNYLKTVEDVKEKTNDEVRYYTVGIEEDEGISSDTLFKLFDLGVDTEVMYPARRLSHRMDKLFNNDNTNFCETGDCGQMINGITIGPDGEFHSCSESCTFTNEMKIGKELIYPKELVERRSRLWSKCYSCSFVFLCGGLCYFKTPQDSRCQWTIFSIMKLIENKVLELDENEIKKFKNKLDEVSLS